MAGRDLAYLLGKTVIDFITNDEKTEKRAFGLSTEINGLYEGLVEMVGSQPPVPGIFLIERLMKIFLRRLAGKARRFGVQADHGAVAIDQYKQIAAGQLRHVRRCILNGCRIMRGHQGAGNGKVGQQFRRARQHFFPHMLEIFKGADRVAQIYAEAFSDVTLNTALHEKQAGSCEPRRNEQHGQQKTRAQSKSGYECVFRFGLVRIPHGFCGKVQDSLANELITHSVYRAEVYGTGWVLFQFLAKLQDVIVNRTGGRVVLITPDFVQQLVPADNPVGILHQELERLEFLSGQNHLLAIAQDFHFLKIRGNTVKAYQVDAWRLDGVAQRSAHSRQQFPGAKGLGYVIVGT